MEDDSRSKLSQSPHSTELEARYSYQLSQIDHIVMNNKNFNVINLNPFLREILCYYIRKSDNKSIENQDTQIRINQLESQNQFEYIKLSDAQGIRILWQIIVSQQKNQKDKEQILINIRKDLQSYQQYKSPCQTQIDQEIYSLQSLLKKQHQDILELSDVIKNKIKIEDNYKMNLSQLKRMIWETQRRIFINSIVAIQQIKTKTKSHNSNKRLPLTNVAKIYFQQCYPVIKMTINVLKNILGEQIYKQKIQQFQRIKQDYIGDQPIITVCHFCMRSLDTKNQKIYHCDSDLNSSSLQVNAMTSPQLYYDITHGLCCNINKKDRKIYTHPYTSYSYFVVKQPHQQQPICNRVYCAACYQQIIVKQKIRIYNNCRKRGQKKITKGQQFVCGYCSGWCECQRCKQMDNIIKSTAYYQHLNKQSQQITSKFIFPKFQKIIVKKKQIKIQLKRQRKRQKFQQSQENNLQIEMEKTVKSLFKMGILSQISSEDFKQVDKSFSRYSSQKLQQSFKTIQKNQDQSYYQNNINMFDQPSSMPENFINMNYSNDFSQIN